MIPFSPGSHRFIFLFLFHGWRVKITGAGWKIGKPITANKRNCWLSFQEKKYPSWKLIQQIQRGCLDQNTKNKSVPRCDGLPVGSKSLDHFCAESKQKQCRFLVVWSAWTLFLLLSQVASMRTGTSRAPWWSPTSGQEVLQTGSTDCTLMRLWICSPHVPNKHIRTHLSQEEGLCVKKEEVMSRKTRRNTSVGLHWVYTHSSSIGQFQSWFWKISLCLHANKPPPPRRTMSFPVTVTGTLTVVC